MSHLPDIRNTEVKGKKILLRLDLDVPLQKISNNKESKEEVIVGDDTRITAGLSTVEYLLENKAVVLIIGHLGRPKGVVNKELSLKPVANWFLNKFGSQNLGFRIEETRIGDFEGWKLNENLYLLENLRFYDGEEKNDDEFSKKLSSLADIYVNDAFAMSHRNHSSVVGVTYYLPSYAGIQLQKEVTILGKVLENPKRPLVVLIGGVKIETKLPLVSKMLQIADYVLVGGKIAQEKSLLQLKVENSFKLIVAKLNQDKTSITDETINDFIKILKTAKMIVWNGPVGLINPEFKFENSECTGTEKGSFEIAKSISESEGEKIVGGGDTIDFLKKVLLINKYDFVSTGGGAMLSFLSGEKLPGIEALIK